MCGYEEMSVAGGMMQGTGDSYLETFKVGMQIREMPCTDRGLCAIFKSYMGSALRKEITDG